MSKFIQIGAAHVVNIEDAREIYAQENADGTFDIIAVFSSGPVRIDVVSTRHDAQRIVRRLADAPHPMEPQYLRSPHLCAVNKPEDAPQCANAVEFVDAKLELPESLLLHTPVHGIRR